MLLVTKNIFVILTLTSTICRPTYGMGEHLRSFVSHPVRELNKYLTQNAVVRGVSDVTGDAIAAGTRPLTDHLLAVSRAVGGAMRIPKLFELETLPLQMFVEEMHEAQANEDARLHITQLVSKHGYTIHRHTLRTGDNYVLTMYRMPPKNITRNNPAVLLMHGLLGSSDDWVVTGPGHALAYILVDRGYDVWLGNARGNVHSRRHVYLSPAQSAFWDFSWNEIGRYDLPAMIDSVLAVTGRRGLKYVGHSQGTTSFYVMCSELPEYNEKIEVMVSLSPVAWMSNVASPIVRTMAAGGPLIYGLFKTIGINEFLPSNAVLKKVSELFCADNSLTEILCGNVLFLIGGFSLEQMNATTLPIILGHTPAGASVKQLAHYGQEIVSGEFRKFDYGLERNYKMYGAVTPPSYRVDRISAPVALFYSEKDWLASPVDVEELRGRLGNVVDAYRIPRTQFNHFDYLWGVEAKELVFERISQIFTNY